jgi:flagellar biosynthesis/type III secretory pathway protein FliH
MIKALLLPSILFLTFILSGCSNSEDKAFQRGYEKGYSEGRTIGQMEGDKIAKASLSSAQAVISSAKDSGYQVGHQAGYQEGYEEAKKIIEATAKDSGYKLGYQDGYSVGSKDGYKEGYQKGFDESTSLFGPKDELVKVLSYKLTRNKVGWVEVSGEVQNLSNSKLSITIDCALIDSNGGIITSSSVPFRGSLQSQQKAFFSFSDFYERPQAVDARFSVVW